MLFNFQMQHNHFKQPVVSGDLDFVVVANNARKDLLVHCILHICKGNCDIFQKVDCQIKVYVNCSF